MDHILIQNPLPMVKKEKKFIPGESLPAPLIGTAGVLGLKTSKRNLTRTIACAVKARRRDKKKS